MYEETGHATKEDMIKEVETRVDRLVDQTHKMSSNEADFVRSLHAKIKRWGNDSFISAKQVFWLRDLDDRYTPDPRQPALFEDTG